MRPGYYISWPLSEPVCAYKVEVTLIGRTKMQLLLTLSLTQNQQMRLKETSGEFNQNHLQTLLALALRIDWLN